MSDPRSPALDPPVGAEESEVPEKEDGTDPTIDAIEDQAASVVGLVEDGDTDAGVSGDAGASGDADATDTVTGVDRAAESDGSEDSDGSAHFRMALVVSVNVDLPTQHPTVMLREIESPRRQLSFSVALPDGVTLSHAVRRIPTPRPLTQELLSTIIQGFRIDVVAVRLVGRQGGVYFAEIDLRSQSTRSVYSCRPSDALTVALLQPVPVPILVDERLFEGAGDVTPGRPPA